jgi:bacterioferritin-associated ferredoxin
MNLLVHIMTHKRMPRNATTAEAEVKPSPYEMVGGESGVRQIVNRFYDIMNDVPEAARIRAMHAADLSPMRERLFEFLSGWLGGPPLMFENSSTRHFCAWPRHSAIAERDGVPGVSYFRFLNLEAMDMIVCSCNVISDHEVRGVALDPTTSGSMSRIYRKLGRKPDCGRCQRAIKDIVSNAISDNNDSL